MEGMRVFEYLNMLLFSKEEVAWYDVATYIFFVLFMLVLLLGRGYGYF